MQVCILFLGHKLTTWERPSDILPFKRFQQEKEAAAAELQLNNKLSDLKAFRGAVKVSCLQSFSNWRQANI